MNKYPSIQGFYPTMPRTELDNVISTMTGYSKKIVCDTWDVIESKSDIGKLMIQFFYDDKSELFNIGIFMWREFFGFYDETMTFNNLVDVFKNYFLQGYNYEDTRIKKGAFFGFHFWNNEWSIFFKPDEEIIGYSYK